MATKYDENKIILTQRNFFAETYKFSMRCLFPCVVPIRYVALYALQSGSYLPSPEWIKRYMKMAHGEAQALLDVLREPKEMTIEECDSLFFERNLGSRNRVRYFVAGPLSSLPEDREPRGSEFRTPQPSGNTVTPDGRPSDYVPVSADVVTSLSQGVKSTGQSLINTLRAEEGARGGQERTRNDLTADFEPFLDDETPSYRIDRDGDATPGLFTCPDTLEEMLFIVRRERHNRLDVIEQDHVGHVAPNYMRNRTELGGLGVEEALPSTRGKHVSLDDYM